ncbi:hypothetical protein DFJ74DRAFT_654151 [Hyaloraphidium curvatum]|nr:hypothetical protein DFJ74DRAFT_654151 [Hyaloraphidium curvatum]
MARVLFIHGLEGSPTGIKSVYLKNYYGSPPNAYFCPEMPLISELGPGLAESYRECIEMQRRAVAEFKPSVIVGSSFGGAIAVDLIVEGTWKGPTLLLACAHGMLGRAMANLAPGGAPYQVPTLPAGVPVLMVHATKDPVVPFADSLDLLANAEDKASVRLLEVDDTHGLRKQVQEDLLFGHVEEIRKAGTSASAL